MIMNKTDTLYERFCNISAEIDKTGEKLNELYLYYMTIVEEHLSPKDHTAHEGLNALDDALTNLEKSRDCVSRILERWTQDEDDMHEQDENEGHDNPRFMNRFTRVQ